MFAVTESDRRHDNHQGVSMTSSHDLWPAGIMSISCVCDLVVFVFLGFFVVVGTLYTMLTLWSMRINLIFWEWLSILLNDVKMQQTSENCDGWSMYMNPSKCWTIYFIFCNWHWINLKQCIIQDVLGIYLQMFEHRDYHIVPSDRLDVCGRLPISIRFP